MAFDILRGRRVLMEAVMNAMIGCIRNKVPETGIFKGPWLTMKYPGTEHQGRLYAQYSEEHGCALRASMVVKGTDCEISNYVFFGSKQECIAWLEDDSHIDELMGIYDHLMEKADEKM